MLFAADQRDQMTDCSRKPFLVAHIPLTIHNGGMHDSSRIMHTYIETRKMSSHTDTVYVLAVQDILIYQPPYY